MKETVSHIGTRLIFATGVLFTIGAIATGVYWDKEPELFDVKETTISTSEHLHRPIVQGSATTAVMMEIIGHLFNKPGGYVANDMLPPGFFMDNVPSWEHGALIQVRDLVRLMRDHIAKSVNAEDDEDIVLAETRFGVDHRSWIMPDAEAEFLEGNDYLSRYLERLADPKSRKAYFNADAENLSRWLEIVEGRLGVSSQKLMASVGQKRISASMLEAPRVVNTEEPQKNAINKTTWHKVDNVFYQARGTSWAILQLLKAAEIDYAPALTNKNAKVRLALAIRELEAAQSEFNSPMVLNGDPYGILANHSLILAVYLTRANAAIVELREILAQG